MESENGLDDAFGPVLALGRREGTFVGNDELNFTEEEARCWADDPRNQAQPGHAIARYFAIWLFVLLIALVLMCLANLAVREGSAVLPGLGTQ